MTRRVLSSSYTFVLKVAAPFLLFPITGFLTAVLHDGIIPGLYWHIFRAEDAIVMEVMLWTVCGALFLWVWTRGRQFQWVAVDDEHIHISDYLRTVSLPLPAVVTVRARHWLAFQIVTLKLSEPTPWGRYVRFVPRLRDLLGGQGARKLAEELTDMARMARAGKSGSPRRSATALGDISLPNQPRLAS